MAAQLTIIVLGYAKVGAGVVGNVYEIDNKPPNNIPGILNIYTFGTNISYGISTTADGVDFQFSRYVASSNVVVTDAYNKDTFIRITDNLPARIYVYFRTPFYVQLFGSGTVTVTSTNPRDTGTSLIVSGTSTNHQYFENTYRYNSPIDPTIIDYYFNFNYAPPGGGGYSFAKWVNTTINPFTSTQNPYPTNTYIVRTNTPDTALKCYTNVALTVGQQDGSGTVKSSPAGITTTDSITPVTSPFLYGSNITLTPTPAIHNSFLYWITPTGNQQTRAISLVLTAPTTITAVFGANVLQPILLDYSPSQSERADAIHICECPCDCACVPVFTSALNRSRQIRALISGSCCMNIPVIIAINSGGSGYSPGTILQLQGGVPLEQPALFRVVTVNGGGSITSIVPLYGQPYRVKPTTTVMTVYSGSGSGASFTITWEHCPYPANLYRN